MRDGSGVSKPANDRGGTAARKKRHSGPHTFQVEGWFWAYIPRRRPSRVSLRTRDAAVASERFAEHLQRAGTVRCPGDRPTEEALALIAHKFIHAPHGWTRRTRSSVECRAPAFVASMQALGAKFPSQITTAKLDEWRLARMNDVSRATINRDEMVARRMLRWAREGGLCDADPFGGRKLLREPRRGPSPVVPSPREIAAVIHELMAAKQEGAALAIAAQLASGARIDELRHLTLEDLDDASVRVYPEKGVAATSWTTKSYRERRIPLSPVAHVTVKRFIQWRTRGRGKKGKKIGLSETWLAERIDPACEKAKVDPFRSHDLRRTFVTENVRNGVPITVVRDWCGHRDVQTTERYIGRYKADVTVAPATSTALAIEVGPPKLAVVKGRRKGGR